MGQVKACFQFDVADGETICNQWILDLSTGAGNLVHVVDGDNEGIKVNTFIRLSTETLHEWMNGQPVNHNSNSLRIE